MIPPEAFAAPAACDADPRCGHAACFQVQVEAAQPEQADRKALACAYHVAEVIETLRAWAREHDLAGGQLTILAIEPAGGGYHPGGASGTKTAALHQFAFSTIPLKTIPPGPAPHREPTGP
jgi:hypothetical protein